MLRKLAQHILIAATAFILSAITVMTPTWAAFAQPIASTATQLPTGRYLIVGGESNQKPSTQLALFDAKTQQTTPLKAKLSTARKNHSATLLPDGRVFIYGGTGSDNITLGTAELYDPASGKLSTVAAPGLVARSHHSATLLTNGKILIVGGLSNRGFPLDQAEQWNPRTSQATPLSRGSSLERSDAAARLLPDGNVLYQGGVDRNQNPVTNSLLFKAESERFEEISLAESANLIQTVDAQKTLVVTTTIPPADVSDFLPGGLITLRFSQPIDVTTATSSSIVLIGPNGAVAAKVTPSQDGILAFLTPNIDLLPATRYTLIVKGIKDQTGQELVFDALGFNTASLAPGASSIDGNITLGSFNAGSNTASPNSNSAGNNSANNAAAATPSLANDNDDESFTPGPEHNGGRWRLAREMSREMQKRHHGSMAKKGDLAYESEGKKRRKSPMRAKEVAVANASPGVSGQVMRINDKPLSNVSVTIAGQSTQTDAQGRFQIDNVAPGHHEIFVDGTKGGNRGRQYAKFVIGVDVEAGKTTEMPIVFLPRIRAQDWVPIASPIAEDQVITSPNVPGMEIHIPKGAVLRERDGRLVTRIALVPIPLDRMAFPFPENAPVFVSVQPGGLVVQGLTPGVTKGIRVIYPNASNEPKGGEADFWKYESTGKGWYVYGKGKVSADGKQIVPNPGVQVYESIGFMYTPPPNSPAPPPEKPDCPTCECPEAGDPSEGDPVSCASGLFLHNRTDLAITDIMPLNISSSYRPGDSVNRAFGIGSTHPYAISLYFPTAPTYTSAQLVLPNGRAIDFTRTSAGTAAADAVMESNNKPSGYFKSRITFNSANNRWVLTTKEGMTYEFTNTAGIPLVAMSDRYGNALTITRNGGQIQRITTPSGRYVDFTYDGASRITKLQDHTDRMLSYVYNTAGYLQRVTYPDASFEEYTYDSAGRMLTVKDRRGNTMVTNVYDTNGRVTKQTLADGGVYQFAYTLDTGGKITRTDVTNPRNNVKRYNFSAGLLTDQTFGFGTPEAQTTTFERQAATNLVTATVDPLGRRTETTYDANGNTTRVTRLAGTANAISESYTYEPTYNQVTSRTDALGKTTTFAYNTLGSLTQVTDPLGNKTKLTYNAAGQLLSVTDALNNVATFNYDLGDLVSVTDPLGRTSQRFIDSLGRLAVATDALGNRTNYGYDVLDRVTQITDAIAQLTQFSYDPLSNLLTLTDARGNVTQHVYDAKNRLITRTDPALKNESYAYDGNDNTIQYTDRKLQVTGQTYDALDRGITTTYADSSTTTNTFDAGNRLTQATDSLSGSITRSYDGLNRLISETSPKGSVSYTYDANSRRTSMSVAGQPTVTYSYDNADRMTQISQGTTSVSYSYDAANRRTGMTLPNGIVASYSYDQASQLSSIVYAKPNATLIGDLIYSYDALGRRIGVTGSLARTGLPGAVASANYDSNNRLTNWGGANITYDANGNMLSDGSRTYTWDARDRLVAISGGATASFEYDAFNRRLNKTVNGTATGYLYDGANPVQELTGATPKANLLTGLGIDEFYRRTDATGARDLLTDALGSVIALADSLAQIKTEYTYAAYGQTTVTGEANANSFQYTGRENDGTGLYFYRARYFNPELSRFISEDPLGFGGGDVNLAAYVGGSPVNFVDPEGLLLTSLHALNRDPAVANNATQIGSIGTAAAAAGIGAGGVGVAAVAGVGAAAAAAPAVASAANSVAAAATSRAAAATVAATLNLAGANMQAVRQVAPGIASTAPASAAARAAAEAAAAAAAQSAARNLPRIGRPSTPKLPGAAAAGVGVGSGSGCNR